MNVKKRKIGKSNLEAYPFVLGGNVFGWTADEKTSFAILDEYYEKGFTLIDTADIYSVWAKGNRGGESEFIIGRWVEARKVRDRVIISTKVGCEMDSIRKGLKREYIVEEVERSLQRLQTDYIDIYFTHCDDLSVPIEEVLGAYDELIKQGKIRHIGASNMKACRVEDSLQIAKSHNLPAYSILQPQYNLYDRQEYENEYRSLALKYELAVFSYYSLASGFLTGKYHSKGDINISKRATQLEAYFDSRGMRILNALKEIADLKGATLSQIALSWLIHQPTITAPIASVSKPEQLDILRAVEIDLSGEEINALNKAGEIG